MASAAGKPAHRAASVDPVIALRDSSLLRYRLGKTPLLEDRTAE
jgi:hypothetical protein